MNRRDFFVRVGGSLIAVPTVLHLVACGGGDDDAEPDSAAAPAGFTGTNQDGSGHSHTVMVLCADLDSQGATYTSSSAGHTHSITLTGEQLASLAAGDEVTFDTDSIHTHTWVFQKPASACS